MLQQKFWTTNKKHRSQTRHHVHQSAFSCSALRRRTRRVSQSRGRGFMPAVNYCVAPRIVSASICLLNVGIEHGRVLVPAVAHHRILILCTRSIRVYDLKASPSELSLVMSGAWPYLLRSVHACCMRPNACLF